MWWRLLAVVVGMRLRPIFSVTPRLTIAHTGHVSLPLPCGPFIQPFLVAQQLYTQCCSLSVRCSLFAVTLFLKSSGKISDCATICQLLALFLFCLEDGLNKNAIVDTWMEENPNFFALWGKTTKIEIIKVTLDKRESSGSAIQFSLRTCFILKYFEQHSFASLCSDIWI